MNSNFFSLTNSGKNTYDLFGSFVHVDFSHDLDQFNLNFFLVSTMDLNNKL